ncbi:LITAF domain-containing protein-like isoform 2-T2 [Synchiropus picturatus]
MFASLSQMEKGYAPQETAPGYPGPPMGAYPPPPGFSPGHAAQPQMGYQGAPVPPVVVMSPALGDVSGQASCPHCHQTVMTVVERKAGLMTWMICGGLTLFGCFLCCCIPFCVDSCKDTEHRCPSCQNIIYVYKRL